MYYTKRHIAIALVLLSVFVFNYTSMNFFSHAHIINGVTIVHSHIYKSSTESKTTKSNTGHTHTSSELTLIAELSDLQILIVPVIALVLALLLIVLYGYRPEIEYHTLNNRFHLKSSPRSPPVILA